MLPICVRLVLLSLLCLVRGRVLVSAVAPTVLKQFTANQQAKEGKPAAKPLSNSTHAGASKSLPSDYLFDREPLATDAFQRTAQAPVAPLPFDPNGVPPTTTLPFGGDDLYLPGVKKNRAGDLDAFLSALGCNVCTIVGIVFVGACFRRRYPKVYYGNVPDICPYEPCFWMQDGLFKVAVDDVITCAGLDQAMLIEFNQLGMRVLLVLGVPLVGFLGPLHCFFGGDRSGDDRLSKWGMANVVDGHPWLYWVHAAVVWAVVATVGSYVYEAQSNFLGRRMTWLKRMPAPRSTTILVERIPEDLRSDQKIKAYFDKCFGREVVEIANIVKVTDTVEDWAFQRDSADRALLQAHNFLERTGKRSRFVDFLGNTHDGINYWTDRLTDAEEELAKEVKMLKAGAEVCLDINSDAGFVTFSRRRDAEAALRMKFPIEVQNMEVSIPPDPADVLYQDFKLGEARRAVHHVIGYFVVAILYLAYLPCVVLIVSLLTMERLSAVLPFLEPLAESVKFSAMWDGMVGSLSMQLFMGLVPGFLVFILLTFFHLKAESYLQHMVQMWYFNFLVIFLIVVTSLGSSLFTEMATILEHPSMLATIIAVTVPKSTHFYLNFIPLLWVTHALDSLRLATLGKYLSFGVLYGEDVAKDMSEPEDQDYHGIGSRSARHAFSVVLCLVFCTLTPLITLLGLVNCMMCRMVYGYLVAFAEVRKPDTGGFLWVSQLKSVLHGLFLFVALMVCVLSQRAADLGPCLVAAGSLAVLFWYYWQFQAIRWEILSLDEVVIPQLDALVGQDVCMRNTYEQPELADVEKIAHSAKSKQAIGRRLARAVRRGSLAR